MKNKKLNRTLNRTHKDDLFRMLFTEKEELLSLYNAVRGTDYTDVSLLEVRTLRDATYLSIKNDVSFIIDKELSIYEHQSTWNGNMPFRNLQYVTDLFAGILADKNVYGSKVLELPNPCFVTFYNGKKDVADRVIQKLSDAYAVGGEEVNLELKVVVLNINHGHNLELMHQCRTLREYAYYIEVLREYSKVLPIEEAVEKAIKQCIDNDVLAEFLRTHRAEVAHVSIYEYDAEKHIAMEKEESWNEGQIAGQIAGHIEGHIEGQIAGHIERSVELIRTKMLKSKSLEVIADELECEVEEIRGLYDVVKACGPESSMDEIMKVVMQ